MCDKFGQTKSPDGKLMIQNNEWGADDHSCITPNNGGGFTVTGGPHHKSDSPAAYPSAVSGCWQGSCTAGTPLPRQLSSLGPVRSSIAGSIPPGTRSNLAYDAWLDPTPRKTGQNTGLELMIWLKEDGGIKPIGQKSGTATLAGASWDVYRGSNGGTPVLSYVRQPYTDSADNLPISDFVADAVKQGAAKPSDYLTNIQAGFEPWQGGPGLSLGKFSVDYGGAQQPGTGSSASGATSSQQQPATSTPGGGPLAGVFPAPAGGGSSRPSSSTGAGPGTSSAAPSSAPGGGLLGGVGSALPSPLGGGSGAKPAWTLTAGLAGFKQTPWNNEGARDPAAAPSPNVPGRQAVKFEAPPGGKRTEAEPEGPDFHDGEHKAIGLSALLDRSFDATGPSWQDIVQLHQRGDGSPVLGLGITQGQLWLAGDGNDHLAPLGPVTPGQPLSVVMDVQFAQHGGQVSIWRDGRPVLQNFHPPAGTMSSPESYLKTGIYRDPSAKSDSTLYLNDLKIGDSPQAVSSLAGAPGSTQPQQESASPAEPAASPPSSSAPSATADPQG